MERLTSYDPGNQEILINEEEKLLSSKGYVDDKEYYMIVRHLAERLFRYENEKESNLFDLSKIDFGLRDKNGDIIHVGDRTRLVLDNGEIREFDVVFTTHTRNVNCYQDFDDSHTNMSITGIFFKWLDYLLLPCVDGNGVSDVSKMEVIK